MSPPTLALRKVCETICQSPFRSTHRGPRSVESGRSKLSPGGGVGVGVGVLEGVGDEVEVGVGIVVGAAEQRSRGA